MRARDHEANTKRPSARAGAIGQVAGVASRVLRAVRSAAVPVMLTLITAIAGIALAFTWHLAGIRTRDQQDLYAQGGLLLDSLGFVCTLVLVSATIWYASLTKKLVHASELARVEEAKRWALSRMEAEQRRVEDAAAELFAGATAVVGSGAVLAEVVRHRPIWSLKTIHDRTQFIQDDMVRFTRRYEQFRIASSGTFNPQAEAMYEATLAYFKAACSSLSEDVLTARAALIFEQRSILEAAVRGQRTSLTTADLSTPA